MYAVIRSGSHQYKATVGSEIVIEKLPDDVGEQIELHEVYLVSDGDEVHVGHPTVPGAVVRATILEQFRGPKVRIFKHHPRKRYRLRKGHRQDYMRLRIDEIVKGA